MSAPSRSLRRQPVDPRRRHHLCLEPGQQILETIVDSGGNDTIDWSGQLSPARIDLGPGTWSELGPAYAFRGGHLATTLFIDQGTVIENARGGSGKDLILGNDVANRIEGGPGNDLLHGGGGDDVLVPGPGNDKVYGEAGIDTVIFHGDPRRVRGGGGKELRAGGRARPWLGQRGEGQESYSAEILQFDDASIPIGTGAHGRPALLAAVADLAAPADLDHLVAREAHVG